MQRSVQELTALEIEPAHLRALFGREVDQPGSFATAPTWRAGWSSAACGSAREYHSVHTTAAFTQWIGGRESKSCSQSSPPSRPIQSWPVVVPR